MAWANNGGNSPNNIKFYAISGIISTILELIFAIVAIYRFDLRKGQESEKNKNIKNAHWGSKRRNIN